MHIFYFGHNYSEKNSFSYKVEDIYLYYLIIDLRNKQVILSVLQYHFIDYWFAQSKVKKKIFLKND